MERRSLYPIRMLGFGFYWAWLFLTCVSPSLLFGKQLVLGLPLETVELIFRLAAIAIIVALTAKSRSANAVRALLLVSLLAGTASSIMLMVDIPGLIVPMIVLMGVADAAMFILWLCFFGNEKVGQVAVFLAASYASGAVLTLFIAALPLQIACACMCVLPLLSCFTFQLSSRKYISDGTPISIPEAPEEPYPFRMFPFVKRLCVAITLYALIFGLATSTIFMNDIELPWMGPAIEAPCCILIGTALAVLFWKAKNTQAVYRGYQAVPLVMALGAALFLITAQFSLLAGCTLVMLGYLLFEILTLNDLCNAVKLNGLSPVRMLGAMRIAITLGMLIGWILGALSSSFSSVIHPLAFMALISFLAIVVASTLIFTEKEIFAVRSATQERLLIEDESSGMSALVTKEAILQEAAAIETKTIEAFGKHIRLSKREMDVLPLLLEGKTAAYISEQLYIAPGTVKTHIYNIYQKLDVHSKMEMLDAYYAFRDAQ